MWFRTGSSSEMEGEQMQMKGHLFGLIGSERRISRRDRDKEDRQTAKNAEKKE